MPPLAAYLDRLSARPGETIRCHASGPDGEAASFSVVRVINADPNPELGGVRTEAAEASIEMLAPLAAHPVARGSYGVCEFGTHALRLDALSVAVGVWRRAEIARPQALVTVGDADGRNGLRLGLDADGTLTVDVGIDGTWNTVATGPTLNLRQWTLVALTRNGETGSATFSVQGAGIDPHAARLDTETASHIVVEPGLIPPLTADRIVVAGGDTSIEDPMRFTGRLERPLLYQRDVTPDELMAAFIGQGTPADGLVACWDFSREIETGRIVDAGPNEIHGRLVNGPTRAVCGARWQGHEMAWRHAPDAYGAIHFHADDVEDCGWPAVAAIHLPPGLKSGQYALMVRAGGHEDNVPFFVAPPRGDAAATIPRPKIAVLVSTLTYTVYANHARPEWRMDPAWQQAWRDQIKGWPTAYPHNPGDHTELGLSTYNVHEDGSGISIASWHRPILNTRLGYLTYPYPDIRASGLRHYPADTHLTQWLEAKGHDYDIITDWELHHEGHELLAAYPVVMTGSHPEYHTRQMIDALQSYRDGGGRLCYLGGNGFYWKIAISPERDGVVEIRRAEGGIRAWAAEPGEYYNQFDGEYGGLWRRNGRPPQELSGVGFTAQGNFVGSHYRICDAARTSRAAWILEGLAGDVIGAHGFSGHGAAGFELDRADTTLGTPGHAITLAQSEDHPPEAPWVLVPEERLTHLTTLPGDDETDLIRADIVFFETAGGRGAVFSTGSITFCGSLPTNGFDNDVSTLLETVVRRFCDPAPFPVDDVS